MKPAEMSSSAPVAGRMPLIDIIKAVGCLAIVAHHLAFYGPMSDFAYPLSKPLFDWLYAYGRMAVQAFLVVAGFLCAMHLAPTGGASRLQPWGAIVARYRRLVVPLLAALTLAILCSAVARVWMNHESISDVPNPWQLIAHMLLLQDLVNQQALSAGVWYVAIDFQLFVCMALLFAIAGCPALAARGWRHLGVAGTALLTLLSLEVFNRNDDWDETALFYFAYYGLGALAYWASDPGARRRSLLAGAALTAVVAVSLWFDFRWRIGVAAVVALLLGASRLHGLRADVRAPRGFAYLGRISYSVFLVHFPVSLVVNAAFFRFLPHAPWVQAGGLVLSFVSSVAAGAVFYAAIEGRRLSTRSAWTVASVFVLTGLLAWWWRW